MKEAEWDEVGEGNKSRPNQNKTLVFSCLKLPLLTSAHADIKLPLSCL